MTSSASQGNSFKLEEGRFILDVQRKFFNLRGGEAVEQVTRIYIHIMDMDIYIHISIVPTRKLKYGLLKRKIKRNSRAF